MVTQEIRRRFLNYFRDNGHSIIASSPVAPHDDPTLMFTNAGMNQFKDVFLGETVRDYSRAVTSQKCLRAGGKHNDLDNVGHTKRHLTFFEMLGNFSFGDYFKEEAIRFAWEVSTEVFEFDVEKIWATVYQEDDEAFELWTKFLPIERIQRFGEKDNFWSMGDTGPCGPCTELYYDLGSKYGDAPSPYDDTTEERYLEFWNLVFMQFNRSQDGIMVPLPKPSIDTGAGLERVVEIKMQAGSVFETDILRHLIGGVESLTGKTYDPTDSKQAPCFQVIADHLRSLSFAIADGLQPSNVDRGYVLRKILRRAVRYGRNLGIETPFLAHILPRLIETMGGDYPELKQSEGRIAELLTSEEEAFFRTLRRGGNILNQIIQTSTKQNQTISGDDAFKLKDTYGLPIDEIELLAYDADLKVDMKRFQQLDEEARERSRSVHKTTHQVAAENVFTSFASDNPPCQFLGYDQLESEGKITGIVVEDTFVETLQEGQKGLIILDRTPFYSEKGGQVADKGRLQGSTSSFTVTDCQSPYTGIIAHVGTVKKGTLKLGETVKAVVETERRQKIANNHTATHLLHWALRKVLGEHVRQAGSVVDTDRLRFDFSHHKALTKEELRTIEDLVNEKIRHNKPVEWYEIPYDEVQKRQDIIQFFDEKYGATVRVIDIDFSKELCGGTHTTSLGNIGLFRIAKEGSIAAGVRRIEAVTGSEAEEFAREGENTVDAMATLLKTQAPKVYERVEKLLEENKALAKQIKEAGKAQMGNMLNDILSKAETIDGVNLIAVEVPLSAKELRIFAEEAMDKLDSGILVLASRSGNKCQVLAGVTNDLINKGIQANAIIKELAPLIQGGGGGKPNFAQAGGTAPDKVPEALEKAKELTKGFSK